VRESQALRVRKINQCLHLKERRNATAETNPINQTRTLQILKFEACVLVLFLKAAFLVAVLKVAVNLFVVSNQNRRTRTDASKIKAEFY